VITIDKENNTVLVLQQLLLLYIIATTNLRTDTLTYYTKRTAEGCAFYLLSVCYSVDGDRMLNHVHTTTRIIIVCRDIFSIPLRKKEIITNKKMLITSRVPTSVLCSLT